MRRGFIVCLVFFSAMLFMPFVQVMVAVATDSDSDGIPDYIEKTLGSDSTNSSDVIPVNITGKTRYLVDTNSDGKSDKFYDGAAGVAGRITTVGTTDAGKYLIDLDGDSVWDYVYDPVSKTVTPAEKTSATGFPWLFVIIGIIVVVILVIIGVLFKLGYISIYEEVIEEKK